MSVVTDIIVTCGVLERDARNVERLNQWLATSRGTDERGQYGWGRLTRVDELAGGTKAMQGNVYLGAFNHFDLDGFITEATTLLWDTVAIFAQDEYDERGFVVVFHRAPGVIEGRA